MRARYHGEQPTQQQVKSHFRLLKMGQPAPTVGHMFPQLLTDPENLLPVSKKTVDDLLWLGGAMAEDSSQTESSIPAAYTYFGQFIDHDITKTVFDASLIPPNMHDPLEAAALSPVPTGDIARLVFNQRTAPLDLDSLYEGLAKQTIATDGRFTLSELAPSNFPPIDVADRFHDLPRRPLIPNPVTPKQQEEDRQALIGDPRNDENLLVAQLHVAFLRSHNALIDRGLSFEEAKSALSRRYQWAVLHDFLPRVCDPGIVSNVLKNGPKFWKAESADELIIPLEFSVAAYRFGHSMIRAVYRHNSVFGVPPSEPVSATFNFFFTFTALSGDIQPGNGPNEEFETLPDNWPIEWHRFFSTDAEPASQNPARRIDTRLTPELGRLRDFQGMPFTTLMGKLATRNLLRGYLLNLPTGQAVARHIGVQPLGHTALLESAPIDLKKKFTDAGFLDRTPLWYYILAEAGDLDGPDGEHLGPVGSTIVAETFWNLAKFTNESVIDTPPAAEELATGEFSLRGIIKMGQDKNMISL